MAQPRQAQMAGQAQQNHHAAALYIIRSTLDLPVDITQLLPLIAAQANQALIGNYSSIMLIQLVL